MALKLGGLIGEAAGQTIEFAVGFGLGIALGGALEPVGTEIRQAAYRTDPNLAVDPDAAAGIVAEDVEREQWGIDEAAQWGVNEERFRAIVGEALTAPSVGELLTMLRRGTINADAFLHGLRKAKLEGMWDSPVSELRHVRLDPAVIATAIQRGILPDPNFLPVGPPTQGGKVKPMPVANIDTLAEAAASGLDAERAAVLTRIVGLPAAPDLAARATFRGIIDRTDFDRAIAEGNTRNEWRDAIFDAHREIPTPHDYIEARLRGWLKDDAEMHAGTQRHGMADEDADLLHKVAGRPLSFHQVFIGLQRGGEYDGPITEIHPAFLKQLQESNIRPEWYNLAWAQRYTLPSAFVIRALLRDGAIEPADGERLFIESGWPPDLAAKVAGTHPDVKVGVDSHVKRAQGTAFTALHRSYVGGQTDRAQAEPLLTSLGVPAAEQARILALWDDERGLRHRAQTPTTVHREHTAGRLTTQQAIDELVGLGMSAADARAFLETPLPGGG